MYNKIFNSEKNSFIKQGRNISSLFPIVFMKIKYSLILLYIVLLTSCENTLYKVSTNINKEEAIPITQSETMFNDLPIGSFFKMRAFNGNLLLNYLMETSDGCFQLLDENTQTEESWFGKASEQENLLNPVLMGVSCEGQRIHILEGTNSSIVCCAKDSISNSFKFLTSKRIEFTNWTRIFDAVRLDNGFIVASVLYGGTNLFVLIDSEGKEIKRFGKAPLLGNEGDWQDFSSIKGQLCVIGNSLYYVTQYFAYMAKYELDDNLNIKLVWERYYDTPQFVVENSKIKFRQNNRAGFYSIAATDDYIICTYSGKKMSAIDDTGNSAARVPQYIVVFNHNGDFVRKYKTDEKISELTISSDKKYLYCSTVEPDLGIMRIPINEIINKYKK